MKTLNVKLGSRAYPIKVGRGAFDSAIAEFKKLSEKKRKIFCIADTAVMRLHPDKIAAMKGVAEVIGVKGGEASKCVGKFGELCSELARRHADRKSAVVALGGGVIGDLAGFVAASFMRGVDFYQIPTTLLAMVDSSVGGKTGVNIAEGKNLVGAFHQPRGVFTDISFLDTLPKRQFAAGMAELVKCAILGDAPFFAKLDALKTPLSPDSKQLSSAIVRACELKAKVVADDECETKKDGGRALLNLGHTFGHAIEHGAGYGKYMHGEAVSIGTVMAAVLSRRLGKIDGAQVEKIVSLLSRNSLPVKLAKPISADEFIDSMRRDKKSFSGALRFVVINAIGNTETAVVDEPDVRAAIDDFFKM